MIAEVENVGGLSCSQSLLGSTSLVGSTEAVQKVIRTIQHFCDFSLTELLTFSRSFRLDQLKNPRLDSLLSEFYYKFRLN